MGGAITTVGTAKNYTYGDTTFKDRLTNFNGNTITYDAFGNPLNYMGKTMSWYGRELESIVSGSNTLSFKYGYNGLRLSKTYNGTKTSYRYEGSKLLSETKGNDKIWYLYNDLGIAGIELNGISYYYVRNLSGDVTKLIDTNGNVVVEYTYDSWGKILSTTGTLAKTVGVKNPIRYRGYYYDTESNLYYLQSRYYDPETGRFISTDAVAENGNLYAYCQNDPINNYDPSGYLSAKWKKRLIKIAIGAVATVAAVAITVATGGSALPIIASVAVGTAVSAGIGAGVAAIQGGSGEEILNAAFDGASDGFMWGGIFAFGGATINAIKVGGQSVNIASSANVKATTSVKTNIYGKAHGSQIHQNAINKQVANMQASGQYSDIWLNKALNTAGLKGTQRPDIIGKTINGKYQYWEFASKSQASGSGFNALSNKMELIDKLNGLIGILIPFGG